jgi:hypothetical protein
VLADVLLLLSHVALLMHVFLHLALLFLLSVARPPPLAVRGVQRQGRDGEKKNKEQERS